MNDSNFSEIPNDAIVLLGKMGITNDAIDEVISAHLSSLSYDINRNLVERKIILPEKNNHERWFKEGFPSQIIEPRSVWKRGRLRLRIVAEFILEGEGENPPGEPNEPSLDEFRE